MKKQTQQYWESRRHVQDMVETAGYLCGLLGDNKNPLSIDEIKAIANSNKPYAGIFRNILEA